MSSLHNEKLTLSSGARYLHIVMRPSWRSNKTIMAQLALMRKDDNGNYRTYVKDATNSRGL